MVLSTLFYGADTWPLKVVHGVRLNRFHRSCVRSILGVSWTRQWEERLSSAELAQCLGIDKDIGILLRQHRLRWLGHIARMNDKRMPKQMLFGELPATRPRYGPKKRCRDVVCSDLSLIGTPLNWYTEAQNWQQWRDCIQLFCPPPPALPTFPCGCGRQFRRSGDLKRHRNFCSMWWLSSLTRWASKVQGVGGRGVCASLSLL